MSDESLEQLSIWQDVLDEIVNGRTDGHKCPVCKSGTLDCTLDEGKVDVKCLNCGAWFRGHLA